MQKSPQQIRLGKLGEDIACVFLFKNGYKILQRNFKARYGELDIIALHENTLVFIEVKTRTNLRFGTPEEAITPRKLHELIQTAQYYVILHPELPKLMRIDVIGIMMDEITEEVQRITHTENITS